MVNDADDIWRIYSMQFSGKVQAIFLEEILGHTGRVTQYSGYGGFTEKETSCIAVGFMVKARSHVPQAVEKIAEIIDRLERQGYLLGVLKDSKLIQCEVELRDGRKRWLVLSYPHVSSTDATHIVSTTYGTMQPGEEPHELTVYKSCDCGCAAVGSVMHSLWCSAYSPNQ